MSPANCPDQEELLAYAAGKISDQTANAVADHIDECTDCQAALETMDDAEDSLVVRLRRAPAREKYQDETQYEEAMGRAAAVFTTESAYAAQTTQLQEVGEYQLLEKLGEGGMGMVYKALQTKLQRVVALKLLPQNRMDDQKAVARFEREMAAIGGLDHPNIVRATHAGEHEGTSFLVMDYVDGLDLSEVARRCGPMPVSDACELVRQAAVGLQYVNDNGMVHRDVKPSNLMLTSEGQVKVLDLGLALLQEKQPTESEVTAVGQAMGTADYIAPEQAADSHTVDIRADVYSLGCTLFRLLTGRPPYVGKNYKNAFEKMMGHVRDPLPSIRELRGDLPETLVAVIEQMLAKNPDDRLSKPEAVAEAMTPFAQEADLSQLIGWAKTHDASPPAHAETLDGSSDPLADGNEEPAFLAEEDNAPYARFRQTHPFSRRHSRWSTMLVGLAVAGILAFAAIVTVVTDRGTLEIRTYDDDVRVSILKGGREVAILDTKTDNKLTLHAGQYGVKLTGGKGDLQLNTNTFTLRRGDKVIVEVRRRPPIAVRGPKPPPFATRLRATLPTDQWVDLLKPLDLGRDRVKGNWKRKGEAVSVEQSSLSRLMLPVDIQGGYDLQVEFTRDLGDGCATLFLPSGSRSCALFLSGDRGRISVLAAIDGRGAWANSGNPTIRSGTLINGRRYKALVRVRPKGDEVSIEVVLDGQPYISWKGKQARLSVTADWLLPRHQQPGLGAHNNSVTFHSARLRLASGKASWIHAAVAGQVEGTTSAAIAEIKKLGGTFLAASGGRSSWSPDATKIVYPRLNEGLWILDLPTGKQSKLLDAGKDPAWSPDGRLIAYARGHGYADEVWLVEPSGENPRQLAHGGWPTWSSDGKTLFFQSRNQRKLMAARFDGSKPKTSEILDVAWLYPAVSSDGKQVAYRAGDQLVVADLKTGAKTRTWPLPPSKGLLPAWSPDGKLLGFGGYGRGAGMGLWIVNVERGQTFRLASGEFTCPVWSPDGSKLTFNLRTQKGGELWMLDTKTLKDLKTTELPWTVPSSEADSQQTKDKG
jgi:serine/threonine protein kinase/Tol biopolymer transport system component